MVVPFYRRVESSPRGACRFPLALRFIFLFCLVEPGFLWAEVVVQFRQGEANYTGTEDTHISVPARFYLDQSTDPTHFSTADGRNGNFATDPENEYFAWDWEDTAGYNWISTPSMSTRFGYGDEIGLLRFRELFGDGASQIPLGAQIQSATLFLYPDNRTSGHLARRLKPGDSANLFEALLDWNEGIRWETFGPVPGPDIGVDFKDQIAAETGQTAADLAIDVTASLQSWSADPESNRGWVLMPSGTQDIIVASGSTIANISDVRVDLQIDTPRRSEIVVTLRHGNYTALLVNRLNQPCTRPKWTKWADIDVTLDDSAAVDIHDAGTAVQPLSGTYKPDGACYSLPLCTGGGTGGLCGQSADGDWVLSIYDEYGGTNAQLTSWAIHVNDGINPQESYVSSPALAIPTRSLGGRWTSHIWSSESADPLRRPMLEVTYVDTVRAAPSRVRALPGAGGVEVEVTIPPGSNAVSPVTVTAVSDASGVAQAPGSPLVFAAAGATTQNMALSIGSAGMAHLTLAADGGLGSSQIIVEVTSTGVGIEPAILYRGLGDPSESATVTIPHGVNTSAPVTLSLSSTNPAVANFLVNTLEFPAGTGSEQTVGIDFGSTGSATLVASDDAGGIFSRSMYVVVNDEPSISYEMNIRPYVQLGDAPAGAVSDQFAIVWQTMTLATQGPDQDHFEVEYRLMGSSVWLPGPPPEIRYIGSESRRNHAATVVGLNFDSEYEYRLIHYRNGVALAGGTHQASVKTRKSDNIVFTVSANTGGGNFNAIGQLPLLAAIGPDLHFFNGDAVYYYGERELFRARISDIYTDLMATTPTVLVTGNHEMSNTTMSPSEAYGQPYADQVFMPDNGPAGDHGRGRNYSFDVGPVHFAVVNTGLGDTLASAVGPWLAVDLAASSQPWKIVVSHELPVTLDPYSVDRQYTPLVREHVLKPAVENGANLFIGGAAHSYQRYRPITAVDVTQTAPEDQISWATCNAGAGTTLVYSGNSWLRPPAGQIPSLLEAPMEVYGLVVGLGLFEVNGNLLTVKGVDLDGTPFDTQVINNCQNPAECSCPVCGDSAIEAPEMCDDGNSAGGDGCSAICQTEYHQVLYGLGEGGSVTITMDGLSLVSISAPGDQSSVVLEDLASRINAEPGLGGAHAEVVGTILIANAPIESIQVDDPGLSLEPGTQTFSQALYGISLGGSVSIVVEGVTVTAATTPGQLPPAVLTDLANRINATLAIAHAAAQVVPPYLTLLAPIDSFTVNDAGLEVGVAVPSLEEETRRLLFLLLAGLGALSISSRISRERAARVPSRH